MEDQSPASMGPLHMERFSLVLWAMPSIKIIITLCTFSCHLHWIWSRKRFCAKCLAQHLLSPVQQRSHLPIPTLEILGDNSFIHLAQKWCPLEMCKYAWTTMLGVYKMIINVKWIRLHIHEAQEVLPATWVIDSAIKKPKSPMSRNVWPLYLYKVYFS